MSGAASPFDMAVHVAAGARPASAEQLAEQVRDLDLLEEQDILQARIAGAENLPFRAGEWQHDNAGMFFPTKGQTDGVLLNFAFPLSDHSESIHACV